MLFLLLALLVLTTADAQQCIGTILNETFSDIRPYCQEEGCKTHWRIVVIVITDDAGSYEQLMESLKGTDCSEEDSLFFMSQPKFNLNRTCSLSPMYPDAIWDEFLKYNFTEKEMGTTVQSMEDIMSYTIECMNNLTLSADQGAKVFVLTDIDCAQLCSDAPPGFHGVGPTFLQIQAEFIASLPQYNIEFSVHGKETAGTQNSSAPVSVPYCCESDGKPSRDCSVASHVEDGCRSHWRIVAIVATDNSDAYYQLMNVLRRTDCSENDEFFFLSQSKFRTNRSCFLARMSENAIFEESLKYNFTTNDANTTGDDLVEMMRFARDCMSSLPLPEGQGARAIVFTDLDCTELCGSFQEEQYNFINSLNKYNIEFHMQGRESSGCTYNSLIAQCAVAENRCVVDENKPDPSKLCWSKKNYSPEHFYGSNRAAGYASIAAGIIMLVLLITGIFRHRSNMEELVRIILKKTHGVVDEVVPTDDWELDPKNLEVLQEKPLGSGAFAVVYEGRLSGEFPVDKVYPNLNLKGTRNEKVAVKTPPAYADSLTRYAFLEEIRFMKELGYHSHLLGMFGCQTIGPDALMVLEYCEHGDLQHFLRKNKATVTQKDLVSISWQISDGLYYLKKLSLIHRDLAARNVLMTTGFTAKISDFGLCRKAESIEQTTYVYVSRGGRLPFRWMAPESLRDYVFSFDSDIWSFGVVLWETFTLGEEPFSDVPAHAMLELLEAGKRLEPPADTPDFVCELMELCRKAIPEERISIEDVRTKFQESLIEMASYYGYLDVRVESE